MLKRFGLPPKGPQRYHPRPGAYAILLRENRLLLTYQAAPHHEWQLPGGGIDPGESPLQALHREVFEETGWQIAAPRRLGAYRRFTYMPEYDLYAEKICHIYLARPTQSRAAPPEPDHSASWHCAPEACTILSSSGDRHFMRALTRRLGL